MIVVKLMGGLGNQMFQYAAGRCLSYLHKTELKLDLAFLNTDSQNKYTQRHYTLNVFNINAGLANELDLKPFLPLEKNKITRALQRKLPILYFTIVVNESGHTFHKEFYSYPKNVYLNGFWQSEKYFEPVKDVLIKEFTLKEQLNKENKELENKISAANSVSLHIRRGDYVTSKETLAFHGTCSLDYYKDAINHLKNKAGNIDLFVFSDDINWVKENLKTDVPIHFVDLNNPSHIDLHLMSACKHNIIANSSFSWWGAWLNQNPDKTVIAPLKWFAHEGQATPDIYPHTWIRL
jgi:hypothetical protein